MSTIVFAVDSSGSTGGQFAYGVPILEKELALVNDISKALIDRFSKRLLVLWDDHVVKTGYIKIPAINAKAVGARPTGLTDPSCFLKRPGIVEILKDTCGLLCVITDGEISQPKVNAVARLSDTMSHLPVIVLVVSNDNEIRFSVPAPFVATSANALIVHVRNDGNRVIYSKGAFEALVDLSQLNALPIERGNGVSRESLLEFLNSELQLDEFKLADELPFQCNVFGLNRHLRYFLNSHQKRFEDAMRSEQPRSELAAAIDLADSSARRDAMLALRAKTDGVRKVIATIQQCLQALHTLESAGYTAEILNTFKSNREMRARTTELDNSQLNTENAARSECPICMDDDVETLLLSACDKLTDDFTLTFPLTASNPVAILPDLMGLEAAETIRVVSSHGPFSRLEYVAVLPLVQFSKNGAAIMSAFAHAFTGGKLVPSLGLISFAVFARALTQFRRTNNDDLIRRVEFVVDQLLDFVHTTPNFTDDVHIPKVTLRAAFLHQARQCAIYRMPERAFNLAVEYIPFADAETKTKVLQRYDLWNVIRDFLYVSKKDGHDVAKQMLIQDLYNLRGRSIPIVGTARIDKTPARTLLKFHLLQFNGAQHQLESLVELIATRRPRLFDDDISVPEVLDTVNEYVNRGAVDDVHAPPPPFVTRFGPSVLRCSCGFSFTGRARRDDLTKLASTIQKRRAAHFQEVYRSNASGNPDSKSLHYSLHAALREVYTDALLSDDQIVAKTIENLEDRKNGYLSCHTLENDIRHVIPSLRTVGPRSKDDTERVSLVAKLKAELEV